MSPADIRLLIMVLNEMRELVNSFELATDWLYSKELGEYKQPDLDGSIRKFEKQLSKRIRELEDLAERMEDGPPSEEDN